MWNNFEVVVNKNEVGGVSVETQKALLYTWQDVVTLVVSEVRTLLQESEKVRKGEFEMSELGIWDTDGNRVEGEQNEARLRAQFEWGAWFPRSP